MLTKICRLSASYKGPLHEKIAAETGEFCKAVFGKVERHQKTGFLIEHIGRNHMKFIAIVAMMMSKYKFATIISGVQEMSFKKYFLNHMKSIPSHFLLGWQ